MKKIDVIQYNGFETGVKITEDVEAFLLDNNIDLKLSSRIPSAEYWYERLLFHHLKDRSYKKFELIYCGIIENPDEYESLENIIAKIKVERENIVFDGSLSIPELKSVFIRWVVVRV